MVSAELKVLCLPLKSLIPLLISGNWIVFKRSPKLQMFEYLYFLPLKLINVREIKCFNASEFTPSENFRVKKITIISNSIVLKKMALLPQFTYNLYLNPVLLKYANLPLKVFREIIR